MPSVYEPSGGKVGTPGAVPRERLDAIRIALGKCWSHGKIYALFSKQWSVTRQTIYNYVQRVYEEMAEEDKEARPHRKQRIRESLEEFYDRAMQEDKTHEPNFPAAIQALDRLARIDGCYEPERIEMSGGVAPGPTVHITSINFHSLSEDELNVLKRVLLPEEKKPALLTANIVDMK